jgi:hypothetical protein
MAEIGPKTAIIKKIMTFLKISPFYYQHLAIPKRHYY